ncbi:hypothetical protein [Rhodococcus daqingensis]|uniref:Tat pathway signal protein n=1 Tax=Rhodococcus daqingensis TaxID=2479363 RepID=A0ABW2RS33_9NOCA
MACAACVLAAPTAATADPDLRGYLDVPESNRDGTAAGGVDPALPLDRASLESALVAARSSGVDPRRYASLLRQYWLVVGAENAQIDLDAWDPRRGLAANLETVNDVYVNYLRLTNAHPELYWSGMAGLAGVSFAAGFYDLGDASAVFSVPGVHQVGAAAAELIRAAPPELAGRLPGDVRLLATEGGRLTSDDLDWYIGRLLTMQKHIFMDMVPMHEAYSARGREGIEEFARAGLLDDNIAQAWRSIFDRTPQGYADALVRMASREQNQIIADQWDATASSRGPMGRALTYLTTVAGKPAVPGTRAPGIYAPLDVQVDISDRALRLRAPLPDFNWADREPRWAYIAHDLAPSYVRMIEQSPAAAATLLRTPFADQMTRGRLGPRLPDLLRDLTSTWELTPGPAR